jgi:hypothetical protein
MKEKETIKKYKEFDPYKELKKIRLLGKNLPLEDKIEIQKIALEEYKEKLIEQRKGISKIILKVISYIKDQKNLTINKEFLNKILEEDKEKYLLTKWQIDTFKKIFNKCYELNKTIQKLFQEKQNDKDLFFTLFNFYPTGEIKILNEKVYIYIIVKNLDDFKNIIKNEINNNLIDEKIQNLKALVLNKSIKINELKNFVVVEYENEIKNKIFAQVCSYIKKIKEDILNINVFRIHEEQHIISNLIYQPFKKQEITLQIQNSINYDQEKILRNFLESILKIFKHKIQDEILAYYKEGLKLKEIYKILTEEKGIYDYHFLLKDKIINDIKSLNLFNEDLIEKTYDYVFKYKLNKFIIQTLKKISNIQKQFKSKEEVIYFFISKDLKNNFT